MIASYLAYSRPRRVAVCGVGLIFLGALLEVAQSFIPDRFMSGADAIANTAGILVAILAVQIWDRLIFSSPRAGR